LAGEAAHGKSKEAFGKMWACGRAGVVMGKMWGKSVGATVRVVGKMRAEKFTACGYLYIYLRNELRCLLNGR